MFIVRISSMCFMLALLCYYVPKALKKYNPFWRKAHMVIGGISALAMLIALVLQLGTQDQMKYIAFTIVMGLITGTGWLLMKKRKNMRGLHIISTLSFFVVLFGSIMIGRM